MTDASAHWLDRPTFVTGATGLVGGWLVRRLIECGAQVVCLVRDHEPRSILLDEGLLSKVSVVHGDVTDQALLERALGEYEIHTVIHLAAQTIVGVANRNPISTFESNIKGTWALLEAARRSSRIGSIVLASSDKAYGDQTQLPYHEDMPLQGKHPYDVSKSCSDLIGQAYAKTYELPVAITRCGNFYGGGDLNWNRVVPGTIRSVIRDQRPIIRSDGQPIRDYLYVEDGAAAYMHLAEQLAARPELCGKAYNFSTEQPLSVMQIVEKVLAAMDSTLEPDVKNEAHNEIQAQYLDAARARNELGWSPAYSLDEGLTRTIAWYRRHFESQA
ncbi:NAD-dependent epimerase/dehydratase family protein [Planctomycetales bacterium ZRK34]|nr:NAD-dependent epimerase/dehydratase family protein [Planctomycetales bacterium ZRK34]